MRTSLDVALRWTLLRASLLLPVVALLAGFALGASGAGADGETHRVLVRDYEFVDAGTDGIVTVAQAGHVVEFVLESGIHTASGGATGIVVEGYGPDSPVMSELGERYLFPLEQPGVFAYTCLFHPQMQGFIVAAPDQPSAG